jgi:hypothetical protein
MSHLVLRMGDLLHFHPFAHWHTHRNPSPTEDPSARIVEWRVSDAPDDLAFFSLSIQEHAKDRRADLDEASLCRSEHGDWRSMDDAWPPPL